MMVLLKSGSCQLASLIPPECHHGRAVKFLNYIVTYIATRDVSIYMTEETGVGFVVLRSSDPNAAQLGTFLFFFLPPPLAPLSLDGTSRRSEESERDEDAGGGNAEKFITARAAAVADLILRSAARTSRPWCLLMYALGYLWRRSGRMALWSTDVLRPPKFDVEPLSIGSLKREQNLLPPAKYNK